jgi:hypothetical protein
LRSNGKRQRADDIRQIVPQEGRFMAFHFNQSTPLARLMELGNSAISDTDSGDCLQVLSNSM